jgi:hypothetical protein
MSSNATGDFLALPAKPPGALLYLTLVLGAKRHTIRGTDMNSRQYASGDWFSLHRNSSQVTTMQKTNIPKVFEVDASELPTAIPESLAPILNDLLGDSDTQPETGIATLLATAANAWGRGLTLTTPQTGRQITPQFNLGICNRSKHPPAWIDLVRAPFLEDTLRFQDCDHNGAGTAIGTFRNGSNISFPGRSSLMGCLEGHSVEGQVIDKRMRSKSEVLSRRFTPTELEQTLKNSYDGCLELVGEACDPVESYLGMRARDQREFVMLLNLSWKGFPLFINRKKYSGSLAVFWITQERMLLPLFETEFLGGDFPPPVLWLPSSTNRYPGEKCRVQDIESWRNLVRELFDLRSRKSTINLTFSDEASMVIGQFQRDIDAYISEFRVPMPLHLVWLPSLAVRVAALFRLFKVLETPIIRASDAVAATLVVRWLAACHLRMLLTSEASLGLPNADKTTATDKNNPSEVMFRKIQRKAPVTRRELWRSYSDPKADTFQAVLTGLLKTGKIIVDSKKRFLPVQNADSLAVMAVDGDGI